TCQDVIIIHRGRVALSSSLKDLAAKAGEKSRLVAVFDGAAEPDALIEIPGVEEYVPERLSDGVRVRISARDSAELAPRLARFAASRGWAVRELHQERPTLEDLFVEITGEK